MTDQLDPVRQAIAAAEASAAALATTNQEVRSDALFKIASVKDTVANTLLEVQVAFEAIKAISIAPFDFGPMSDALAAVAFPPATIFNVINAPTEDTGELANQAIQDAIYAATGPLYLPAGRYLVDAEVYIRLKSGLQLYMHPDAILVVKANANPRYYVFLGEAVEDVLIQGGQIVGDRLSHRYVDTGDSRRTHEWGMGIGIRRGKRITLRGIKVRYLTGDGYSISGEDLHVVDCVALYCRRQGLSIYSCRTVRVIRGEYAFTGKVVPGDTSGGVGTKPMCGIDIEPDAGHSVDVLIDGPWVHDNASSGILAWSRNEDPTRDGEITLTDVRIRNVTFERNTNPVETAGYGGVVHVDVRSCRMSGHTGAFGAKAMSGSVINFGGTTAAEANIVKARSTRTRSTTPGPYDLLLRTGGGSTVPGSITENLNYYE